MHALAAALALVLQQAQPQEPAGPRPYFQQDIRFTTAARLDEPSGVLSASGRLWYKNNSADTLSEIFFHLYLNAFRPGSKWVAHETAESGHSYWAALPDPYYAYERLGRVAIEGRSVEARYPGAPDSTVVEFALPRRLPPGDSMTVDLEWTARLSVIPRRQGRFLRRYDFAQWYPEVATYDRFGWEAHPLYPEGEFYGEYGDYDVTLDLMSDQVCGSTGVPVSGDPGWASARATPETPVTLQADWYGAVPNPYPLIPNPSISAPGPGRKLVRFVARDVEHFAFSCNPEYRYEEGHYGRTVIHVLYLPSDTDWANVAVQRSERALQWLDWVYGQYAWPQLTAVHRIEGGGTEFPMMVMLGGAGEGLILHEVGHEYTYGILGNNEWKEGWLDEGFTSFQTSWYYQREAHAPPNLGLQTYILGLDLDGWSQPVVLPAEEYSDYAVYASMIYSKGQLIYGMLRYVLGEETFHRAVREYYARYKLKHVSSESFQQVCEDVSHQDLGWFFSEWLHGTPRVDYALKKVRRHRDGDWWVTDIEIARLGDGVMPVDIAVPVGDSTVIVRARGMDRSETVEVRTAERPGRIELDPARQTMDWNYLNNYEGPHVPFAPAVGVGREEHHFGWSGTQPSRRDRRVVNWMPLAWYNDGGGLTLGFQSRANYMGRFELAQTQFTWPVGPLHAADQSPQSRWRPDYYVSFRNPVMGQRPRLSTEAASWSLEGRTGGRIASSLALTRQFGSPERASAGASVTLHTVTDVRYVDRRLWNDVNTAELTIWAAHSRAGEGTLRGARVELTAGDAFSYVTTPGPICAAIVPCPGPTRSFHAEAYARGSLVAHRSRRIGAFDITSRSVIAGTLGGSRLPLQRRIFLAGADPYETFTNPFLRSSGALFAGGAHYQATGGGALRGFSPYASATWLVGLNVEAGPRLVDRPRGKLFNRVSLAGFADVALLDPHAIGRDAAADAGLGLRAYHRIGPTRFVTRLDFPLLVSRPAAAVGGAAADGRFKFRAIWSLEEAF